MSAIVDFHSHVLPGIDDGSKSVEESIAILRAEAAQGIACVVATPHFYAQRDHMDSFLERRRQAEALLREEMSKHPDLPRLVIGAEVLYFQGISNSDAIRKLTIGSTDYILVEMPLAPWRDEIFRELEHIRERQGLIPIIAHLDRYIRPFHTFGIPKKLAQLPVLVQANGDFFLERGTASMALRMLRAGSIHLLGSDCHNLDSRKPNLGEALQRIEKRLGADPIARIAQYQKMVLDGE